MTLLEKLDNLIAQLAQAEGTTLQAALRDVLTDLRHIAVAKNLDFDLAEEGAVRVFQEEQGEASSEGDLQ
jgi:sulfur carrier protein ThiS